MIYIVLSAFLIRSIYNLFYHLFWWERKEYRIDRMFVHLSETRQGKNWLLNPLSVIKWFFLVTAIFAQFYFPLLIPAVRLFTFIYLLETVKGLISYGKESLKRPKIGPRSGGIFLGTGIFLTAISLYFWQMFDFPLVFFLVDKLTSLSIAFFVFLSNRFFQLLKMIKLHLAKNKVKKAPNLKIIGITGSYGKTTTKEFTAQILSSKFKVLKTLASQNTDIGIAELILRSDLSKYDYFVCEMSAYKRGEIENICRILRNHIIGGVITGINEQHQSLFKSLENTMQAKFELIEAVNSGGFAVFNGSNKYSLQMLEWAKKRKLKSLLVYPSLVNEEKLEISLPGDFFKENLSLAVSAVKFCGLKESRMAKGIKNLQLPSKTMNIIKKRSLTIIDDTFNANPDGVYQALNYLRKFKGKKILVLQPLIELGKYADSVHEKIGRLSSKICDAVVLANPNFNEPIIKGAGESGLGDKIMYSLPKWAFKNTVILFEGKESDKFLKYFK